jgi:hypothetical protein
VANFKQQFEDQYRSDVESNISMPIEHISSYEANSVEFQYDLTSELINVANQVGANDNLRDVLWYDSSGRITSAGLGLKHEPDDTMYVYVKLKIGKDGDSVFAKKSLLVEEGVSGDVEEYEKSEVTVDQNDLSSLVEFYQQVDQYIKDLTTEAGLKRLVNSYF